MLENQKVQYVYGNKIGAREIDIWGNSRKEQIGNWRTFIVYEIAKKSFSKEGQLWNWMI